MPTADGLSTYLETLPPQRRERFASLSNLVAAIGVPESIESFVFLPGQTQHPRFDDAADVFWHAVERLYLSDAASDGELPLVYWGFHSYDILLRRSANGMLLTDRTAYLVDVGRSSARLPLARIDPRTIVADSGGLHVGDAVVTLDGVARLLDATSAVDSAAYLREVIAACQQAADEQQTTDAPPPTTFSCPPAPKTARNSPSWPPSGSCPQTRPCARRCRARPSPVSTAGHSPTARCTRAT
jgi:hypothetical protein